MTRRAALALAAVLAAACSGRKPAAPDGGPGPAAAAAGVGAESAYVVAATALRREPSEQSRIPGPPPRHAQIANAMTTLLRGEKVTLVSERDEWAQVRASDETQGWIKKSALIPGAGVVEATLSAPADAFDRPDLLAVNARRKIEAGTLLLVVRSRELFSEVNTGPSATAWVLSDRLVSGPRDVMVAKLIEKARWLTRIGKPDDARTVIELARSQFADVALTQLLSAEQAGAPEGAAPVPGAQPGTPAPSSPFASQPASPPTEAR